MKKFNLERALAGDTIITRDGGQAVIVKGISAREDYGDFLAVVSLHGTPELIEVWNDGRHFTDIDEPSLYDLFMATVKKEGWINIYKDSRTGVGAVFKTEEGARATAVDDYVTTIKIEWEE